MMFSQRSIISCVTACCCLIHIKSTHSFVVPVVTLQTSSTSYQSPYPTTTTKLLMAASTTSTMPEVVGISGCDAELWNNIPYGAQRDLERFCRMAADEDYEFVPTKEFPMSPLELAQNRVATMKDINRFVAKKANKKNKNDEEEEDAVSITPFEDLAWNNGVSSWELNNLAQKEMAIAKVKADKKAANKLLREEAGAKAEAEAAEKAKEAEAEKTDTTMENDDDDAFQ
mmetsp:Transcript_26536/g.29816  ORF Transcript_26536/g.29816 Transcript_26536/m.29816 type:complete len:228 (-) Transcript_26536:139-822(-)